MPDVRTLYEQLPHAGNMRLIDEVVEWNDDMVVCRTNSHLDKPHPLCVEGRLPMLCALEYAAQACGLHGVLTQSGLNSSAAGPSRAFIAIVNEMRCTGLYLDGVPTTLSLNCSVVLRQSRAAVYRFEVKSAGSVLASGQVGLMA